MFAFVQWGTCWEHVPCVQWECVVYSGTYSACSVLQYQHVPCSLHASNVSNGNIFPKYSLCFQWIHVSSEWETWTVYSVLHGNIVPHVKWGHVPCVHVPCIQCYMVSVYYRKHFPAVPLGTKNMFLLKPENIFPPYPDNISVYQ